MDNLQRRPRVFLNLAVPRRSGHQLGLLTLHLALLVVIVGFTIWLGHSGFIASDDQLYSEAAIRWLNHFPYVAGAHWGLRHAVVLPIALSFWLGGINEVSMVLPTVVYLLVLILVTYGCVARLVDLGHALLAALLIAVTPVFPLNASTATDDLAECCFVIASFWTFYFGSEGRTNRTLLLLSGICAGVAFITRETSAIIVVFYGILFLLGRRMPRAYYFLIACGFCGVLVIDTLYLTSMTGDPLYRVHVAAHSVSGPGPLDLKSSPAFAPFGLIALLRVVQPVLMLFTAHEFGPLFFFVIPAGLWLLRNYDDRAPEFNIARLSGLLGFVWFLTLSYVLVMVWVIPRFYIITAYGAILVVTVWLRTPSLQRISFALIALLSAGDLLMIYLDNKDLMFGEKTLVALARTTDEPIYTDPATLRGSSFLLKYTAPGHDVRAGLAPPGGLFFYNPSPTRLIRDRDLIERFEPRSTWTLLSSVTEEPKLSARIVEASGLEAVLPVLIARKLDPPLHHSYLYRLPTHD